MLLEAGKGGVVRLAGCQPRGSPRHCDKGDRQRRSWRPPLLYAHPHMHMCTPHEEMTDHMIDPFIPFSFLLSSPSCIITIFFCLEMNKFLVVKEFSRSVQMSTNYLPFLLWLPSKPSHFGNRLQGLMSWFSVLILTVPLSQPICPPHLTSVALQQPLASGLPSFCLQSLFTQNLQVPLLADDSTSSVAGSECHFSEYFFICTLCRCHAAPSLGKRCCSFLESAALYKLCDPNMSFAQLILPPLVPVLG